MNLKGLKKELKEVLTRHGLILYEDDGLWCHRSTYYDMLLFGAYPVGALKHHLPGPPASLERILSNR